MESSQTSRALSGCARDSADSGSRASLIIRNGDDDAGDESTCTLRVAGAGGAVSFSTSAWNSLYFLVRVIAWKLLRKEKMPVDQTTR